MNKELLEMSLLLQYYKNNNILDRYQTMLDNGRLVLDKEVMNILDNVEERIYIEPLTKSIEKDKEIERLNNIINELEKYIKTEISKEDFINSELCVNILDKLEELKEGK